MLRRLIFLLALTTLSEGICVADESLVTILEGIRKTYGPLPGLSVPYSREVITRSMSMLGEQARGDVASGRIYFKHPHFLRLEQVEPRPETLIANHDTLWWYVPDRKSVYRYPASDFGKELRLLSDIFRGLAHVENTFQVILHGRTPSGEYEIELIPDPPWQEIERIVITATQKHEIRTMSIHNTLGTVTRFTLGPLMEQRDFEEGFFQFEAPEGVRMIVEGAGQ